MSNENLNTNANAKIQSEEALTKFRAASPKLTWRKKRSAAAPFSGFYLLDKRLQEYFTMRCSQGFFLIGAEQTS
ncbi:hypothetical protein ACTXT7_003785 [Hymenolepis weldensis]